MTTPAVTPQLGAVPASKWVVAAPDGKTIQFPDSFQQSDVEREMNKMYPVGYQGPTTSTGIAAPQGTSTAGQAWDSLKNTVSDLGTGASQGAANTVGSSVVGTAKLLNKIPFLGKYLAPQEGINALAARTAQQSAPDNLTQSVGKGAEQIGEFLLPGAGEEDAVAHTLPFLPKLGKAGETTSENRISGRNHGVGECGARRITRSWARQPARWRRVGEGLRAVGSGSRGKCAWNHEANAGLWENSRSRGARRNQRDSRPAAIEQQAQQKLGQLTNDIESSAAAKSGLAPQQPLQPSPPAPQTPVSLHPALGVIDNEIAKATRENNGQAVEQLGRVRDAITKNITTGAPIPSEQTPTGALNLKRGLRSQFVKNWNPELMSGTRSVAARASGAIDSELDNALGSDFESANQRISSLVPVAERSESLGRDPGIAQRIGNRVAAHTGALIGSAALGTEGYRRGGIPGAIGGAISGAVLPEILASPSSQMAAARIAYKPGALLRSVEWCGTTIRQGFKSIARTPCRPTGARNSRQCSKESPYRRLLRR